MRSKLCIVLIALLPMGVWASEPARAFPDGYQLLDRVAAVVEGDVLTLYELLRQFAFVEVLGAGIEDPEERKNWYADKQRELLDEQINTILVMKEAKKLGVTASPARVTGHLTKMKRVNKWSDEQLYTFLKQQGYNSVDEYRKHVGKEMVKAQMLNYKVRSRITPREDEIDRIFHRDYYGGKKEDEILVQHILIRLPSMVSVPQLKALQKRVDTVLNLVLTEQMTFEEAARRYSEDPGTSQLGGEFGWVSRGSLDPDFEMSAFKLGVGQVSGVVQTQIGYHLIRVLGRRQIDISDPGTVRRRIKMELIMERQKSGWNQWMKELRGKYHVDIRL